jgi:hypothetical protein
MGPGAMSLRIAELGLAALLVLTLALKVTATTPQDEGDRHLIAATMADMLADRGFAVRTEARPISMLVSARKNACRMTVREYPPEGTFAATIADQARAIGPVHFAYRGKLLAEPPKVRPLMANYMRRVEQRLGMVPPREPVIAIAAAPVCDVAALPWSRLASLPR